MSDDPGAVRQLSSFFERHATLFAVGMAGAPQLAELATTEDPEVQYGAAWWQRQGSAIQDEDVLSRRTC